MYRKTSIAILLYINSLFVVASVPSNNYLIKGCIEKYLSKHNNFSTAADVWGDYTIDLNMDAIITFAYQTHDSTLLKTIDRFFELRNYSFDQQINYKSIPFCDVYFSYAMLKKDSSFIKPYVNESYNMVKQIHRTPEQAICIEHNNKQYMLIDYLQNYLIRMARTGYLSGDTLFYKEMVNQLEIYTQILQYPDSKLYSQGKGWVVSDTNSISPSAWLRGQGWLMRGLVVALHYTPKSSAYYKQLKSKLAIFANGLIKKQAKNGMWYNLPLLPISQSYPEVSGSAMIAHYLNVAISEKYLSDKKYSIAVRKAKKHILRYIQPDFSINNISPGPGTLFEVEKYKTNAQQDNPHGLQGVILLFCNPDTEMIRME